MNKRVAWILGAAVAIAASIIVWYYLGIRSISGCVIDPRPRPAPPPQGGGITANSEAKEVYLNEVILVTLYQQLFDTKTVTVEVHFCPETANDSLYIAELGTTSEPQDRCIKMQGDPKKFITKTFLMTAEENSLTAMNFRNWNNHPKVHNGKPLKLKSFAAVKATAKSAEIKFHAFGIKTGFTLWRGDGIHTEPSKQPSGSDFRMAYVKPSKTRIPAGEMLQPVYYSSSAASGEGPSLARWDFAIPKDDPHMIELEGKEFSVEAGTVVLQYELDPATQKATARLHNNNVEIGTILEIETSSTNPDISNIAVQSGPHGDKTEARVAFDTFGTELRFSIIATDMRNRPAWTIGFDSP